MIQKIIRMVALAAAPCQTRSRGREPRPPLPPRTPGAFYIDRPAETRLRYFDLATKQTSIVARNLGWVGLGLSASRDGRTVLFTRIDSSINELTIVDGFR